MKFSTIACLLGTTFVIAAGGISAAACSSSTTPVQTTTPPTQDSGAAADSTMSTTGNDSGIAPNTDSGMPTGEDSSVPVDCGSTPTLHAGIADGGIYCPFGEAGTLYCGAGGSTDNLCCISGEVGSAFPPSFCGAACAFQADAGNTTIQCEDPSTDCPAGNVCCGAATGGHTIGPVLNCSYDKLTDWSYTKCEQGTTCSGAGEFQLCASATGQCPSGQTCTSFKAKGLDLGFCN